MKRRIIIVGVIATVVIAAIWLVFAWQAHRSRFDYSGTVETREIQIGSKVGGRVTEVGVEEGQVVKAGTVLVRFECDELKAQRAQAQASVEQAQADLEKMLRGNRPEEIAQAEATRTCAEAALEERATGRVGRRSIRRQADYCCGVRGCRQCRNHLSAHGGVGSDRHHLAAAVRRCARKAGCSGAAGGIRAPAAGHAAGRHASGGPEGRGSEILGKRTPRRNYRERDSERKISRPRADDWQRPRGGLRNSMPGCARPN